MAEDKRSWITQYIIQNQEKFYRLAVGYVRNPQDAQDVVQNAVVKALESWESLRNPQAVKTWFYRIVVNESISFLRKGQREYAQDPEQLLPQRFEETRFGEAADVLEAVRALPVNSRTVILLHYYEGLTLKEIAEVTQSNLSTVKYRLYAGIRVLERTLRTERRAANER